jgi:hypothetical protein
MCRNCLNFINKYITIYKKKLKKIKEQINYARKIEIDLKESVK